MPNFADVNPANAQSIPKPSVPEFTLRYVVQPYYIPATTPTYTIDPYTGEQKIQASGSPSQNGNNQNYRNNNQEPTF